MPPFLTSSTLIASVKRRAMIPTSQSTFSDDDFLALANEEIKIGMLPSIMMYHEEYFVQRDFIPLQPSVSEYPIPYRAIGGKLRNLQYNNINNDIQEMTRIDSDDAPYFVSNTGTNLYARFYVQNNSIVIVPVVTASPVGSLVFSYFLRPNELVKETRVANILNINTITGVITVDKTPSNITAGSLIDFLETVPGHKTKKFDVRVQAVDSVAKTITFTPTDLPLNLVVGDYIATAQECIIPQIPTELHTVLVQRVVTRCLEALGDTQGLNNANTKLQEMELKTGMLIDDRVEGAPRKINNIRGILRSSRIRRRTFL